MTGTTPGATGSRSAERACHDLLVALAGRLPDPLLWRLRDWLAGGARTALRTAVPRSLLRHRVGITDEERSLLRETVTAWGGGLRPVEAVLHADAPPSATGTFAPEGQDPGWDGLDLVLRAAVPALADAGELRRAWRTDRAARRAVPVPPARVVLLSARGDLPAVTAALQRVLRAQGEPTPRVEVIGPGTPMTAYHRDALANSEILWRAGGLPAGPVEGGAPPQTRRTPTSELVGHG